jgi:subtilisin family serine protease
MKPVTTQVFLILIALCLAACGGDGTRERTFNAYRDGEVIVKFRKGVSNTFKTHNLVGARLIKKSKIEGVERVSLREGILVEEAVRAYESDPDVEYAEPNYIVRKTALPDDPRFGEQWGLRNTGQSVNGAAGTSGADIKAPEAWDINKGSYSVIVAVIDTGVDLQHPDLSGNLVPGYDFVDDDDHPDDLDGHGTHVAGIIGASGNNGIGITGVNWSLRIMPLRVLDEKGEGTIFDVVEAIAYAAANNARVVNMSFSGPDFSSSLYNAVSVLPHVLFVAAAGNGGEDGIGDSFAEYPAGFELPNMLSVASSDQNDNLSNFSNYGITSVDVAAPGENILSTIPSFTAGVTFSGAYRMVYFSFGFEGIRGMDVRQEVMRRVMNFHAVSPADNILLVDDDGGKAYEAFYIQALQSLGYSFDYHAVPPLADGPNSAILNQYKLVIWFTGDEYRDTLKIFDQANLQTYLNSGGGLFVTGQDIGYDIGTGIFYRDYLHAAFVTDDANGAFYTGTDPFNGLLLELPSVSGDGAGNQSSIDAVQPLAGAPAFFISYDYAYQFFSGTSMSTPMTTGLAALIASQYGHFSSGNIKGTILVSVDMKPSLAGKILTGGRINAFRALTSLLAPSNISADAQSQTSLLLAWTDNSTGEDGFKIERKESGGLYAEIASVAADVTNYIDNNVKAGRTYYYRVRGFNTAAFSSYSDEARVTLPGTSGSSGGGGGGCSVGSPKNYQTAFADTMLLFMPLVVIWIIRRSKGC